MRAGYRLVPLVAMLTACEWLAQDSDTDPMGPADAWTEDLPVSPTDLPDREENLWPGR